MTDIRLMDSSCTVARDFFATLHGQEISYLKKLNRGSLEEAPTPTQPQRSKALSFEPMKFQKHSAAENNIKL